MQHITYSPVDRQFGLLRRDLEARYPGAEFNGVDPVEGITFGFADYSRNGARGALDPVVFWGTVVGEIEDDPSILLRAISKEAYDAAEAAEMEARGPTSPPVPETVTMRQAKIQLSRAGKLKAADAAIAAMPGQPGEEARIEWESATSLRRDHPLVAGLGGVLGLDDAAIDDLFRAAAAIR